MNKKNTVVNTSKAMDAINNYLNNSTTNPYLVCKVESEDGSIKEEKFMLDNGAIQIIKAYYKSKVLYRGDNNETYSI